MPIIDGKVVRARYTSLKLDEISSVDRPAQPGAKASILKRHDGPKPMPSLVSVAVAKYVSSDDGAHTFTEVLQCNLFDERIWPLTSALQQAIRSIMGDGTLSTIDREAKVTQSVADFLAAVREISPDAAVSAEKKLTELITKKDSTMPTIDELTAKVAELNAEVTTLKAAAASDKTKMDALTEAKDKAEDAKDKAEKALVEATDEVIKVGGTEIRKSIVGETHFSVTKAMATERDTAIIEKRVESTFSHVAGTTAEKALVLRAAEAFDEPTRKAFDAIITQSENLASSAFKELGYRGAGAGEDVRKARATFDDKVAEIAKRDNIPTFEAMSKARREFPNEFEAAHA